MRIKFDENFPAQFAKISATLGRDVDTLADEKLKGQPDPAIWQVTKNSERFIIIQDLDFPDIRAFVPSTHYAGTLGSVG